MYDLAEVADDHAALWRVIRDELRARGVTPPAALTRHPDVDALWRDPQMLVTQACGWPFVTDLREKVRVVGVFEYAVGTGGGCYRSELIVRRGHHVDLENAGADRVLAVNSFTSLSGWVSLAPMLRPTGGVWRGSILQTSSHVSSVQAVADGRADCALIDGVTLALLRRHRPAATDGIATVTAGPVVPCPPLIVRRDAPADFVHVVRAALRAAIEAPQLADALGRLMIVGFQPVGDAHYASLRLLRPPR